jgi:hypothetical protein
LKLTFSNFPSLANISEKLTQLRTLVSNVAITLVSIALIIVLARQLLNTSTLIEPIQMPAELIEKGLTPQISAQWLIDNMLFIQQQATTHKEGKVISPEWQRLNMEVPGSGLSIKTIGSVIRESLGIVERKVASEVIDNGEHYLIRVRQPHSKQPYLSKSVAKQDIQSLFLAMSELAVQQIDPFMYASYLHASEQFKKLELALKYSIEYSAHEDLKWSYNLLAIHQADSKHYSDAKANYKKAIALDQGFAIAYSNLANLMYKQGLVNQALDNYLTAVNIDKTLLDNKREAVYQLRKAQMLAANTDTRKAAIETYKIAAKKNPLLFAVNIELGKVLMLPPIENYQLAIAQFASIPEQAKEKALSLEYWGDALLKLNDCATAIKKYSEAKKLIPVKDHFGIKRKLTKANNWPTCL